MLGVAGKAEVSLAAFSETWPLANFPIMGGKAICHVHLECSGVGCRRSHRLQSERSQPCQLHVKYGGIAIPKSYIPIDVLRLGFAMNKLVYKLCLFIEKESP
jgi:hypothetical protein